MIPTIAKEKRDDIVLAFVRILSVHGLKLSGDCTPAEQKERIRVTILARKLKDALFDNTLTFEEAYRLAYRTELEQRRYPRIEPPVKAPVVEERDDSDDPWHGE